MKQFIKSTVLLILLLALGGGVATAQQVEADRQLITVNGKVLSINDDEPLVGASVVVIGAILDGPKSVVTDIEGDFSIKVPKGAVIEVSYVGYDKARVTIEDAQIIVRLIPSKPEKGWIYLSESS